MLRSEIEEFKRVAERVIPSHCSFGLCTLKFHLLHHLIEDLGSFRKIASTDARPFEHLNVLIRQSHRMTFRRLWTRLQNTVHNICSMMQNVQRVGNGGKAT